MEREYTADKVPDKLTELLRASDAASFRRRAVLTKTNAAWDLVCCTVELFLPGEKSPNPVHSRHYRQALLYEDFLTAKEGLAFATALHAGRAKFGDIDIARNGHANWCTEVVPVGNEYMERAGYVIAMRFSQNSSRGMARTLLSAKEPYYPDSDEAARDWLPFLTYHGHSDTRNDQVLFLLPQSRAYIADATFLDGDLLEITVAGSETGELALQIKGAYWEGRSLHHVEAAVKDRKAKLVVPESSDRLEYYLIDGNAAVFDFHSENRFQRNSGATHSAVVRALADQVRQACASGEGLRVEFKPFIDLSDKRLRKEDVAKRSKENAKLREVLETVAGFTNAEGGHLYIGVNDDCTITGIGESLREWGKEELGDALINRYLGALKSRIKELMHGEVTLDLSHVEIDGMLVAVIEVSEALRGPVAIQQEFHLYVRSGASNRKAPPEQWKSILNARNLRDMSLGSLVD